MAVSPNGRFLTYQYTDDEGNLFNVILSEGVAGPGGFQIGDPDSENWGTQHGRNRMRGVYGTTLDGDHKVFVPCSTISNLISVFNAGTVDVGGTEYVITGRKGETVSRNRFS